MKQSDLDHTADRAKAFVTLPCPTGLHTAAHTQRQLLAFWPTQNDGSYQILVRCCSCKLEHVWHTRALPNGLVPYHVRIHAAAGPHPLGLEPLDEMSEEFYVLAASRQAAYRQSLFSMSMPTRGQRLTVFIDGEEEQDERY